MGSALTTLGGDPIPASSDSVFVHTDFSQYAESIAHKIIHFVADQNERDVLYAAAAAPVYVMSPTSFWVKVSGSGGGSVWNTMYGDTGEVTSGIVLATNFDTLSGYLRKFAGNLVVMQITVFRRNSTIVAAGSGNIAGDPLIFTLPVGFRPNIAPTIPAVVGSFQVGTLAGCYRILSNGEVRLATALPSATIEVDEDISLSGVFIAA